MITQHSLNTEKMWRDAHKQGWAVLQNHIHFLDLPDSKTQQPSPQTYWARLQQFFGGIFKKQIQPAEERRLGRNLYSVNTSDGFETEETFYFLADTERAASFQFLFFMQKRLGITGLHSYPWLLQDAANIKLLVEGFIE